MTKTIKMDILQHRVFVNTTEVHLTPKEFEMLRIFCEARPGELINRPRMFKGLWGNRKVDNRTVDQHISRLRRKIGESLIDTIAKYGYRLAVPGAITE